ncbi:MAG TPA: L-rhamnose mutarotase [Chitinophagaceae bacterium]|jgi:L-rhamnose mutarotase|nr:L-rhamnose mutarotase [Chitinophagaceae bacterium]
MKRYCLALDLYNDDKLIAEYEAYHKNVWPEIKKSILDAGIAHMEIYRTGNRLFMIMDTENNFSFERKAAMDNSNPKVLEWEKLMWKFQSAMPWAKPGDKWILMDKIFMLNT